MNLGTLMTQLENEADAASALAALGDITLLAAVQEMGARHDEEPGEYVANASRRFASRASDEDWLALMTAMERAPQPGRAALERMIRWSLERDEAGQADTGESQHGEGKHGEGKHGAHACSCGGGGGGCNGHS